jgi:hypothetical protein
VPEWVGHQVDLMPERRQRADPMELAERCPARLEKRLGRDHEDAQDGVIFSRNRSTDAGSLANAIGRASAGQRMGRGRYRALVLRGAMVQMIPESVNGLGVREAAFSFYFTRLGLPIQSGVLVSLGATVLMMIFSLSGVAVYLSRDRRR